ncbi:MAG: hypothetical protein GY711_33055 [bacterium]|nr:hypothetical protein [bacterium]
MADTKRCRACGNDKLHHESNASSASTDGLAPRCRACVNRARRARDGERKRAGKVGGSVVSDARKGDAARVGAWFDARATRTDSAIPLPEMAQQLLGHVARDFYTVKKRPGHVELVGLLVGHEAQVRPIHACEAARGGATPLHYAAMSALGRRDEQLHASLASIARMLLDASTDASGLDREESTPLQHAIDTGGNARIVRALLERGATFDSGALGGVYRQLQRKGGDRLEIAEMIWSSGAIDREAVLAGGFHSYAAQGVAGVVEWHLDRGADVDLRDEAGRTALHWVGERQANPKMARLLLARGAHAGAKDTAGKTTLELAVENGKTRVAAVLRSASSH